VKASAARRQELSSQFDNSACGSCLAQPLSNQGQTFALRHGSGIALVEERA
jgi:hypothetical protein